MLHNWAYATIDMAIIEHMLVAKCLNSSIMVNWTNSDHGA